MQRYYKNNELAKLYGVSRQSVSKWVESVRKGKLDLDTIDVDGQSYICNTPKNHVRIESMVRERKKYLNTRSHKIITPKPEFYRLYTPEQITDIISNLRVHYELPRQYNYIDKGAEYWDKYTNKLFYDNDAPNPTKSTEELLNENLPYVDNLLRKYSKVNVIDIGPGNALPAKSLISHLLEEDLLGKYIAIDISAEMIEIAKRNIYGWFGDKVDFIAGLRDVNYERFTDLLMDSSSDEQVANLVIFLGGTLQNLQSPNEALRTIYHSMTPKDILICPLKLDTEATRHNFHFIEGGKSQSLPLQHAYLVDLLGFDPSLYEVEMGFDEEVRSRYLRIRLKVAVTIKFDLNGTIHTVNLNKDDTLLVWRYWHQTALEIFDQFERNGFGVLQTSQTEDHDCMLTICDIKTER